MNLSWDHFGLHQGKGVSVTMEFEVPKKIYLKAYPLIPSNGFCGGRGKRGATVEKDKAHGKENVLIIKF